MKLEMLLQRLETARARVAHEALQQPQGRDAYAYGYVVGMYAGLEQAKRELMDLVAEKERKDFDL